MDNLYDKLFNLTDEDDAYYHKLIPTIDVKIFRKALKKDIKIINKSTMTLSEWAKFKYELLKCDTEWNLQVFDWKMETPVNPKHPYICININYDVLKKKPSRYFQVHMAIENVWMNDERLVNIWKYIDTANEQIE